jgi:uncharacterized protein YbjT (DUF2867 family)
MLDMHTYLILGGTGKTGRRVAQRLASAGHIARTAARNPGEAEPGLEPVRFDWEARSTWAPALAGASAVYVVPPAMRLDYPQTVGSFLAQARESGVRKAVFLSARGANVDPSSPPAQTEALLAQSGLAWSVLRPSWFAQNFTEAFFRPTIETDDAIVFPAGTGAEPFIDADDIAAVAAALLTDAAHDGQAYDLSGPEALTFAQVAAILSAHAGRTVGYVDAAPEDWLAGLVGAGVPNDYAAFLGVLAGFIRDGHDAYVSDGVQQVLGRAPQSFEQWAARDAEQLRREVPAA